MSTDTTQTEEKQAIGVFRTMLNILLEPRTAFASLRERPNWLLPFALVLGSTALVLLWYYAMVDIPWLMEEMLAQSGAEIPEGDMDVFSQTGMMVGGVIGAIFGIALIWVLLAGYLTLVSALTGDGYRFRNWFSLTVWTAIPGLFSIAGMLITIALSPSGQIVPEALDPLALGNLGMALGDSPLGTVIEQISITYLWSIGLLLVGYQQWCQRGWLQSTLIILLPVFVNLGAQLFFLSLA